MYDIAVIGLGPAGATVARLLDKKYKVIAVDRKNSRVSKCCGGLLSLDAQKILARFDICLPKDVLVNPQIFSVKTIDMDNRIERFYQRFYINMDRAKFDNLLISLIPKTVEICNDSFCGKVEKRKDDFSLTIKTREGERKENAEIVIGADGANSLVRNTFYKNRRIQKYVSIQEWYKDNSNYPFFSCVFDKTITDSYSWTISKDDYFIVGGAFPPKDCNTKFEKLKAKIKEYGIPFGELVKREGCFVYFNKGFTGVCTGKNGAYLIGEAAGMISSSSLEGISYSMESAQKLAKIINAGCGDIGQKYFFETMDIRMKLILKTLKMPFLYNKYLRKMIMKSGIKSIRKGENYGR
jgi:flavin-dependent dehydrogenase